jgi:tetratricopeptide (TPR) repeat protein
MIVTLGDCLAKQKRYAESENILRHAHDELTRLAPLAATTLGARETLAFCLADQPDTSGTAKKEEAERMLREVLAARQTKGDDEVLVLHTKDMLAMVLALQKNTSKMKEAERLQHDVLTARTALLGAQHEWTLVAAGNVNVRHAYELFAAFKSATSLSQGGNHTGAASMLLKAVAKAVGALGMEHEGVIFAKRAVCKFLARAKRPAEAEPIEREVLDAKRNTLGADDPSTLSSMVSLGECLLAQSKIDEAVAMLERAHEACERVLGRAHGHTTIARRSLERAHDAARHRALQSLRASSSARAAITSAADIEQAEERARAAEEELMAMLALEEASSKSTTEGNKKRATETQKKKRR